MKNKLGMRVLEIYEEAERVPGIAAGILAERYGNEDEKYRNLNPNSIRGRWIYAGLKPVALPEYIRRRIQEYAEECHYDPYEIANRINAGPSRYILGHAAVGESIRGNMKSMKLNPIKKEKWSWKGKRSHYAGNYKKEGKKITGVERMRWMHGVVPEAIK